MKTKEEIYEYHGCNKRSEILDAMDEYANQKQPNAISLTKEQLDSIIAVAFKRGQIWGVTYSTWFTPTDEDTLNKIVECQDSITIDLF